MARWFLYALVWLALVARPAQALELEYRTGAPATWFWLLNALAGDSHVETAQWRAWWQIVGPIQPGDEAMWQRFARVRDRYRGPYLKLPQRDNPFVPVAPQPAMRLEVRLASAFLSSQNLTEAWGKAEVLLAEPDLAEMRAVFAYFQPRLDAFWQKQAHLLAWRDRFSAWAAQQQIGKFVNDVARFYGVPDDAKGALRVHFVPAPPGEVLHGRRLGADLVVEVRAEDRPAQRADVVVHEATHACQERGGVQDDPELIRGFFGTGEPSAPRGWELLDEALATAIGQGVLQERVSPTEFARTLDKPRSWYVDDAIDPFAKALFPVVKAALAEGQPLRAVMPAVVAAWRGVPTVPTPRLYLRRTLQIARDPKLFESMETALGAVASWRGLLSEAGALATRYRALPVLIAVTWADLPALRKQWAALGLADVREAELRTRQRGVLARHRPDGGYIFLAIARDDDGLRRVLVDLAALPGLQDGWLLIP